MSLLNEFKHKPGIRTLILSVIIFICYTHCAGQIIPPGSSDAHTASWFSIALSQKLDTQKIRSWRSVSYFGIAFKSDPDNYNFFQKPSILIINQEFYHQFRKNWQYSVALSYLNQNQYQDSIPYAKEDPATKQEFRIYGRVTYTIRKNRIGFSSSFRQEIRKFYTPDFKSPTEDFQLRSRIRLQLSVTLDRNKVHRIIANSEQLFSTRRISKTKTWTNFKYNDSRFSFYYSYSPKNLPLTFNIGYMNNLTGNKKPHSIHHAAFDITIHDPFHLKRKKHTL